MGRYEQIRIWLKLVEYLNVCCYVKPYGIFYSMWDQENWEESPIYPLLNLSPPLFEVYH